MEVVITPRGNTPDNPVYVNDDEQGIANFAPLVNDTYGGEMAINAGFSGTPQLVHNGGDTVGWTPSILAGAWDFADPVDPYGGIGNCLSSVTNIDPSTAMFKAPAPVDPTLFVGLSGQIWLDRWGGNVGDKTIEIQLRLATVNVGTPVKLETVIDVAMLDEYMQFYFNWSDFGVTTEPFDEIVISKSKVIGLIPDFRMDNLFIQEFGSATQFDATPFPGTKFLCTSWSFNFIDNAYTTTARGNLDYFSLLSLPRLSDGIAVQIVQGGVVVSSVQLRDIGDFLASGSFLETHVFFGTRTQVTLKVVFDGPLILRDSNDALRLVISDDLSALASFTSLVTGRSQVVL